MNVQNLKTVNVMEFERREVHLSENEQDEPPYTIHGVALGAGDVTHGSSGIKKLWPGDELQKAAETLQGKNLVVDHNNSSGGVVGRVTKAGYKDGTGVIYEAKLYDEELAEKVRDGLLEVSIRGYHTDVDQMEETDDGAKIVSDIEFDNLSIVPKGASPSNTLEMGTHDELSIEELSAFTETLDELQEEMEPSDFVQWGDNHGVIFKIEGETAMVEVMEEIDGKWRAVGEQMEVDLSDLEMWNLDESNIGEPMDEDSDEEEEEDEEAEEDVEENISPENFMFQSEDRAIEKSKQMGLEGNIHEMEVEGVTYYMPGSTHENFLAAYMKTAGELSEMSEELQRHLMDRNIPMEDNRDMQGENPEGEMPEDEEDKVPSPPEWEDGMLVQWQVEPQLFGRVVHVDEKRQIVMVEIHELKRGELIPTGFTISAGFSDINKFRKGAVQSGHMDEEKDEEMGESEESDSEELEGTVHEPSFSGKDDNEWNKPSLNDFTDESWEDLSNDEKSSIGGHFIFSMTGFPAENFSDMKLPVVRPSGTLSMNAVRNAKARLGQTDGLSSDQRDRVESMLDDMLGDDEEENGLATPSSVVPVLTSDDLWSSSNSKESEQDSLNSIKVRNMTEISEALQAELEELEDPTVVETEGLEQLREKAEKYDDISEDISELRERTEVLDSVSRDLVDELAEADEPMVIESSRFESLSDEAEQVKKVYATNLAEELGAFSAEELMEKFSIEELREKHSEHVGELEEELNPDPKGKDASEEELEEGDDEQSEEELQKEEEVQAKQDELRSKILGN